MSKKPQHPDSGSTAWLDEFDLNDRQRDFVLAYLKDPNQTQAAIEAGYSPKTAKFQASRLLTNVNILNAIEKGRAQIEERAMLEAEGVAKLWADIATADVTELVQNHHGACRYCHGVDHHFQWTTERAYQDAYKAAVYDLFADQDLRDAAIAGQIEDPRLPDCEGGFGYRITDAPNPDCPECAGMGVEVVRMADTRKLSPAAKLLYDGVEETRQGKKIRKQDRSKALDSLAKHLGMFSGKVEDETTNPLTRLAERIMGSAAAVPVRPDPPDEGNTNTTTAPPPARKSMTLDSQSIKWIASNQYEYSG